MDNLRVETTDEEIEDVIEQQEYVEAPDAVLEHPMAVVAIIPIVGLCFGDVAGLGGTFLMHAYLGLTLAAAATLLVIETLVSKRISGDGLRRIAWCSPFLCSSTIGGLVVKLTDGEFTPQLTAWMLVVQFGLALWLFFLSYTNRTRNLIGWLLPLLGILICLAFLADWARQGMPYPFRGWAIHKNSMGVAVLCIGGLSASSVTKTKLISFRNILCAVSFLLCIPVLLACGSRSSLMVLVLMVLLSSLFRMTQSTLLSRLIAFSILIASVSVPIIYINLQGTALGDELTGKSEDLTGQEFFNGRQRIWEFLLEEFQNRPIFGHAKRVAIERVNDTPMSAHNMLMATIYQGGVVGACSLLFMLGAFWKWSELSSVTSGRWVAHAFFAAILVRQMSESELTGENYASMFAIWSTISLMHADERSE